MRPGSIVAGVLTLIVLEVVGRRTEEAGKGLLWLNSGLRRLLSPDVALIPRGNALKTAPPAASGGTQSGNVGQVSTLPSNPVVTV